MELAVQLIKTFLAGLTAFFILLGHYFTPPPQIVSPTPTTQVATTTQKFPTATTTTSAKPGEKSAVKSKLGGQNGLASPATEPQAGSQDEENRGPFGSQVSTSPQQPTKSQETINQETRASLVNILCTTKYGGDLAPISGSGVIIDNRGVILTNAHVAQFFLLRDYYTPGNIQCVVRMGSPAEPYYYAELLYLPPAWVAANASQIVSSQAVGTGENDFAFLRITGPVGSRTLPTSFPAVLLSSSPPSLADPVLLAAYPAQYLGGESISKSLYQSSAVTYVSQLLNFVEGKQIDMFSIGGTVVSQAGSSGGAVVSLQSGGLKGIIAVETVSNSTGTRDLRALTLDYINRQLAAQGQGGLVSLLLGDLAAKAAAFNRDVAPGETAQLEAALKKGY